MTKGGSSGEGRRTRRRRSEIEKAEEGRKIRIEEEERKLK